MRFVSVAALIAAIALLGCAAAPPVSSPTPSAPAVAATATPTAPATATSAATGTAAATATIAPVAPQHALEANLRGPRGLAFDNQGNLYVAECLWTYAAIDKIDTNGMVTRFAGVGTPGFSGDGGPATSAKLYCATGIAVGPDGAVYFADHVNNRVRRIDASGVITTFAGSGPAGLNLGSFSGDGGPATAATLQEPWGVAFDQAGRLYIADRDNARVRMVDTNGEITTVAGTGLPGSTGDDGPAMHAQICPPVGVAIDPAGNLLIPDACESTLRMVDAIEGTIRTIDETDSSDVTPDPGSEGNAVVDANGRIFVQSGPRILLLSGTGYFGPFAGNGSVGAPIDGSSAVDSPLPLEIWGMAVDGAGNLYVADGAESVWRIDEQGVITRFAGKPD